MIPYLSTYLVSCECVLLLPSSLLLGSPSFLIRLASATAQRTCFLSSTHQPQASPSPYPEVFSPTKLSSTFVLLSSNSHTSFVLKTPYDPPCFSSLPTASKHSSFVLHVRLSLPGFSTPSCFACSTCRSLIFFVYCFFYCYALEPFLWLYIPSL